MAWRARNILSLNHRLLLPTPGNSQNFGFHSTSSQVSLSGLYGILQSGKFKYTRAALDFSRLDHALILIEIETFEGLRRREPMDCTVFSSLFNNSFTDKTYICIVHIVSMVP